MKNYLLLLLTIIPSCTELWAQATLLYETYDLKDGLPSNEVYRIDEDQWQQLWVSTANGVVYYDGNRFIVPDFLQNTKLGLVEGIVVLDDQNIWLSHLKLFQTLHYNGQNLSTISTGSPRHLDLQFKDDDTSLISYQETEILFSNRKGTIHKEIYLVNDPLLRPRINSLIQLKEGRLLIGTDHGPFLFRDDQFLEINSLKNRRQEVGALFQDQAGLISLIQNQKIYFLNQDLKLKDSLELPVSDEIRAYCNMGRYNIWLATKSMQILQYYNGQWLDQTHQLSLENQHVNYLYVDINQNLWISTNYDGLLCIPNKPFKYINIESGLGSNFINRIEPLGDKQFLAASGAGLDLIDSNFRARPIRSSKNLRSYCNDVLILNSGSIYTGLSKGKPEDYFAAEYPINNRVHNIPASTLSHDGDTVYAGTYAGTILKKYQNKTLEIIRFTGRQLTDIILFKKGLSAVATKTGLHLFHRYRKDSVNLDFLIVKTAPELLNSPINDLHLNQKGELLIASSIGLYYFKEGRFQKISPDEDPSIYTSVCTDKLGRIYAGTKKGLFCFSEQDTLYLGKHSGLLSDEVSYLFYDQDEDQIWVGGNKGLSILKAEDWQKFKSSFPEFYLDSYTLIPGKTMDINKGSIPEFQYDQNNIRFHLKRKGRPGNKAYAYYQINSTAGQWLPMNNDLIELFNLHPGKYELNIRMSNSPFDASPTQSFTFSIAAPFWQNIFFQLVLGLSLVALMVWIALIRVKQVRMEEAQKLEVLQQVKALELRSLTAMMNPHFLFNSLNTVQHFASKYKDIKAIHYISGISKLLKLQLESLFHNRISLEEEIKRLKLYVELESVRLDSELTFQIEVDEKLNIQETFIPTMMLQPFIENALWHGLRKREKDKKLKLRIKLQNPEQLQVCIEDNGLGWKKNPRERESKHISRGIQLVRERLMQFNNQDETGLIIINSLSEDLIYPGTQVSFLLPFKRS
ncbi:sensor histidine kinase [Croceimicrobium hydrocarbonivorans]|uniref:Histidine kinase n=1 Tax=Croceimicrobium hydrocarbonivorans TaxID=2761580 RepID=A0A7H0VB30_9FLAO|nr:histidine kinase [Croceimicrobium hydrocarbonivorans]QNR22928.1 histidine kinase [Croceimicrobium hydrocarbonivorans]